MLNNVHQSRRTVLINLYIWQWYMSVTEGSVAAGKGISCWMNEGIVGEGECRNCSLRVVTYDP
jgi:hypothetical protein